MIQGEGNSGRDEYRKREIEDVMLDVFNLTYLEQCSSIFNAHVSHLGVSLKCRFSFSNLEWGLQVCISNKLPCDTEVVGLWEDICIKEFWLFKCLV